MQKTEIITLILTPIFSAILSGVVVYFQINKSHLYWEKQQYFLENLEIKKLRILTYRETVEMTNSINDVILNHHIYSLSRDISLALSKTLKDKFPQVAKEFGEKFTIQKAKAEESYLNMRTQSIKFSAIGVNIKVYFNKEIYESYTRLRAGTKEAQNPVMTTEEIEQCILTSLSKKDDWESAQEAATSEYSARIERQRPVKLTGDFLDLLLREFEK